MTSAACKYNIGHDLAREKQLLTAKDAQQREKMLNNAKKRKRMHNNGKQLLITSMIIK
jgi:hypothetical protein